MTSTIDVGSLWLRSKELSSLTDDLMSFCSARAVLHTNLPTIWSNGKEEADEEETHEGIAAKGNSYHRGVHNH
jgi:hypothetical protein